MNFSTLFFSSVLAAILSLGVCGIALAQGDSPCNQGRDPINEPRHPYAICLPETGQMNPLHPDCPAGEQYGSQLAPVGDVDNSGTVDFVVGHRLCDPAYSQLAEELLLYKGVNGALPASSSGVRIGPSERNSMTGFVAAGDWDADTHQDMAVWIRILFDTSFGNTEGFDIMRLVVFWGNDSGNYSVADTTHLFPGSLRWMNPDAQTWIGKALGASIDLDGDGVDELIVANAGAFGDGQPRPLPNILAYKGQHGARWGRAAISRIAERHYWNPRTPENAGVEPRRIAGLDHDGDGAADAAFYGDNGNRSYVSVLYGTATGQLPDTTAMQSIALAPANAGASLFTDVTGDGIPELLAASGRLDVIKVYVGLKGQRLVEQFGSGDEPAHPGQERWWGRPWATLWQPRKINPNWFGDHDPVYDLGDVNLDGINDVWAFSWPYLVGYNGGQFMDSLADVLIDIRSGSSELHIVKRLGNIDGTGRQAIALTTGNGIRFFHPSEAIPATGIRRDLPPGTGKAAVESHDGSGTHRFALQALPNPATGDVRFSWKAAATTGTATMTISDASGRTVYVCSVPAVDGAMTWNATGSPPGAYFATLCVARQCSTVPIMTR